MEYSPLQVVGELELVSLDSSHHKQESEEQGIPVAALKVYLLLQAVEQVAVGSLAMV